jgi:hypothetical protein
VKVESMSGTLRRFDPHTLVCEERRARAPSWEMVWIRAGKAATLEEAVAWVLSGDKRLLC